LDSLAEIRINYFCDEVMELLAERLGIKVKGLVVKHFVNIAVEEREGELVLGIEGKDQHGNNLSFIKAIIISFEGGRS
jgi:hypothetical protein